MDFLQIHPVSLQWSWFAITFLFDKLLHVIGEALVAMVRKSDIHSRVIKTFPFIAGFYCAGCNNTVLQLYRKIDSLSENSFLHMLL